MSNTCSHITEGVNYSEIFDAVKLFEAEATEASKLKKIIDNGLIKKLFPLKFHELENIGIDFFGTRVYTSELLPENSCAFISDNGDILMLLAMTDDGIITTIKPRERYEEIPL